MDMDLDLNLNGNVTGVLNRMLELAADPGFVLVPMDRYDELIRAEAERNILDAEAKARLYNKFPDAATCVRWASGRELLIQTGSAEEKADAE